MRALAKLVGGFLLKLAFQVFQFVSQLLPFLEVLCPFGIDRCGLFLLHRLTHFLNLLAHSFVLTGLHGLELLNCRLLVALGGGHPFLPLSIALPPRQLQRVNSLLRDRLSVRLRPLGSG